MARKKQTVGEYEVHELSVRTMMPLVREMQEDETEGQIALVGASVHLNGEPIGPEGAGDLGMSEYTQLVAVVIEVNGLGDEGND